MQGRPENRPGDLKQRRNQAGSYVFVEPNLVEGTLVEGFARLRDLPLGFARAAFQLFVVSEVHPFDDGNGRVARATMNAELSAVRQARILDRGVSRSIGFVLIPVILLIVIGLGALLSASSVVGLFQDAIGKLALLAVLMPIVSGMGGNAGTQTLAVVVRALATNQLTSSNTLRTIGRELRIAVTNGATLGVLIGTGTALLFQNPLLGAVIGSAMLINNLIAGLARILVPVTLDRLRIDPAVSSAVFVTMATDVMGFFSFLGLAVLSGLA